MKISDIFPGIQHLSKLTLFQIKDKRIRYYRFYFQILEQQRFSKHIEEPIVVNIRSEGLKLTNHEN
jgi:hypothetical protein